MADQTIGSQPASVDLRIYRGDTFEAQEFRWEQPAGTPVNITGYTVAAQIRLKPDAEDTEAEFECTITDAVNGKWTIEMADDVTEDLPKKTLYWDMQLTSPGGVTKTFAAGKIVLTKDVTR